MTRRRFLPKYVSVFIDRHGRERFRFRRVGYPSQYIRAELGTEEFRVAYRKCLDHEPAAPVERAQYAAGTIGDLVTRYFSSATRLGPSPVTQAKVRAVIDKFRLDHGHRRVDEVEFEHIDAILAKKAVRDTTGKRIEGGIHAARKLRKELVRLFDFAVKARMRTNNPVAQSEKIKDTAADRTKGFHSWTEAEIDQYRDRHPIGTRARLAMEMLLWTTQRRSDVRQMGPEAIVAGRIEVTQGKGGKTLWIAVAPQLLEALTAMPPPPAGATTFLLTERGQPWSRAGFGNWFRKQCDAAGLPQCSAHGLRKASMRRMAELDMANQTLKSLSGHSRDDQVAHYTRGADQVRMADAAVAALSKWEKSRPKKGERNV